MIDLKYSVMGQYNTIENTASYNSVHSYIHITCSFYYYYYDDDDYYIHRKYVHVLRLFSFYMRSVVDPETSLLVTVSHSLCDRDRACICDAGECLKDLHSGTLL